MATIRLSSLAPGISKFSQAIVGGQDAYDHGAEQGATLQGKIAQMLAATQAQEAAARAHDSTTALNGIKTGQEQIQLDAMKPEALRRNAMIGNGIPLDEAPNVDSWLTTGNLGGKYTTPTDGMGPVAPKPAWAEPSSPFAKQIMAMNNAIALGDKNSANVSKAQGDYLTQDRIGQAIAGTLDPAKFGMAMAASEGKPLQHAAEFGSTNLFTGAVDNSGPVAQRFGVYRDSETGKNNEQGKASKAAAASSYASAAHSNAGTRKINQEIEQGAKGTYDPSTGMLIDTRAGTARNIIGPDGQPLAGKGANLSEGERKAATLLTRLRGSQDQMLAVLGANPGAAKPSTAAEFVRALPVIGGDTPANMITPEARQRVEAAQLDMLDAALTLGTGAAYTKEQLVGYARSYFPQIGDGPKQVADKRVRLANIIRAAEIAAGRAEKFAPPAAPQPVAPKPVEVPRPDPFGGAPPAGAAFSRNVVVNY